MSQRTKLSSGIKIIPFTGEFHQPEQVPSPPVDSKSVTTLLLMAACLLGSGVALGAVGVYQSPEQSQLRLFQAESKQLTEIKDKLCK